MKKEELKDKQQVVLTRDVKNPTPDRRYRDVEAARPLFEAGTQYVVRVNDQTGAQLQRVGGRYAKGSLGEYSDAKVFDLVVEASQPEVMTPAGLVTYHGVDMLSPTSFVRWLLERGYMSLEQFDRAWQAYESEPDE